MTLKLTCQMMLNEKKSPLSKKAYIEVPDKEGSVVSVDELMRTFPRLARYFDGTTIDRCLLTFYEKSDEKYEGQAFYVFHDMDCMEDMKDIYAECGYILDAEDEEPAPESAALNKEQIEHHKKNMEMIREGLDALKEM